MFKSKTPIKEWVKSKPEISDNLKNILLGLRDNHSIPFQFLENITKVNFLKLPRVGKLSWKEFEKLKGK